ncbi:hypothetical protein [Brevundimonas sp. LjRoot202]|uniref:hypothetical protein n=1 Tax=Brevundimonas sp. LjRoot202 TaxID=3342281 RepID=UPI003ECDA228
MAYVPINRPVRVATDLTASVFEDLDINLFELYAAVVGGAQPGLIEGRVFRRCRLQGPAIVLVSAGVTFDDTNFGDSGGDIRNLLLQPMGSRALGTMPMRNCAFENCEFFNVGFTGPQPVLDMMAGVGTGRGGAS